MKTATNHPKPKTRNPRPAFVLLALLFTFTACAPDPPAEREVVAYVALDQTFSEPLLKTFTEKSGITVKPVYDSEANKTVGLVNRIIAEKDNPKCDVFWNNEIMHTISLKRAGLLEAYASPSAKDIPSPYKDRDGMWTGFAARARVLLVNRKHIPSASEMPTSIEAFRDPKYMGRMTIALPLFGTTSTHAAVLFSAWGPEKAKQWFLDVKQNNALISPGNAQARDRVASGELAFCLTDTDDAVGAIADGKPVSMVFPDADGLGTLVIPNTVALIKGAPHPETAKALIDYILSREVEEKLASSRSEQIPVRDGIAGGANVPPLSQIVQMKVDWEKAADAAAESRDFIQSEYRP